MANRQKKSDGPVRHAIYLRCSSDDQAHKDFSTIDTQNELNQQYVVEKAGVVVEVYSDEGRSGTNLKRPGWEKLLQGAEEKRFDVVVCTYMSRLGRGDTYTVAEYLLKAHGVRVETVKETFTDDVAGYVNKQMTRFVDGMYVENVRQWTKTKMEQMAARGYVCGGQDRFGYRKEDVVESGLASRDGEKPKRLVPDAEEGEIVRLAYALFASTRSLSQARDYLNQVTTRRWNTDRVKYMFRNEVYVGVLTHGELRNEKAHEPLVERDLWEEVNDLLNHSSRVYPARASDKYSFYLRGRVHCPHCGCIYTPYPAKSGAVCYYACMNGMKKRTQCPVMRVNAAALHTTILNQIKHAASHHTVMHRLIAESGGWQSANAEMQKERGQMGKRRQLLEMQIGNIINAIAAGTSSAALVSKLQTLEQEKSVLTQEMQRVDRAIKQATVKRPTAEQVGGVWSQIGEAWPEMTEAEREQAMTALVQKVEVKEKNLVLLHLSPIAEVRGSKFVINTNWERGSDSN